VLVGQRKCNTDAQIGEWRTVRDERVRHACCLHTLRGLIAPHRACVGNARAGRQDQNTARTYANQCGDSEQGGELCSWVARC